MDNVLVGGFDGSADADISVEAGDMYVTYNTDPGSRLRSGGICSSESE